MHLAAISNVTSSYASHPVARVQIAGAPVAAGAPNTTNAANVQSSTQNAATQTVNFGPAVQVQLSQQAQALLVQTAANTQAASPATSQASLALTYQNTAEQVWVQVLGSLGLTQAQLDALPDSQRAADEAKATSLAEVRMTQEVAAPQGVSQSAEASAIDAAVAAISAA